MGAQGVDDLRPLPDQKLASLQHHRSRLLVGRFDRHKSHCLADNRFTDCFRIGSIGFTTLHERLYVGWRNQTHVVTELGDFTRPKMRPSAGLHPDQARRQLLEEPQHVSPTQLPADDRTAVRFSAMDLKYLLGQIQTDGGKPDIFNTDQGSQFTSFAFTNTLKDAGIRISMDDRSQISCRYIRRPWTCRRDYCRRLLVESEPREHS